MMGRLCIVAIVLCAAACDEGKQRQAFDPLPPQYEVVVDRSFTASQVTALRAAVDAWAGRIGDAATFRFRVDDFDHTAVPPPRTIHLYANPGAWQSTHLAGLTATWDVDEAGRPYQARVWLENQFDDRIFSLVATHEMGHSLGLKHSVNPESIMYPSINLFDPVNAMTCDDVEDLCRIWDCDPVCEL